MTFPLVSIVCICYNHENFVQDALFSVLQQTYKNIELIVINNGSTDNSEARILEVIAKNPEIKYIKINKVISLTKAFNLGFKKTSGDYLIDLAADDRLLNNCVEKQVMFFKKQNTNTALIFGNAYHINSENQRIKPFFAVNHDNKVINTDLFSTNYKTILAGGLTMCSVSALFTRKHFLLLNGYNEELFFEDLDYWLRLSKEYEIQFLDDFLVEKRYLEHSLGNQFFKKNTYSKKINESLRKIFYQSLQRNSLKAENKALLKRIHYSMEQTYKNKQWIDLCKFTIIMLKCRVYLLK